MNLTFDVWEGSELATNAAGVTRKIRVGVAEGLTVDEADPESLFNARTAVMNALPSLKYPNHNELQLTQIILRGRSSNSASVQLVYESFQGVQPSVYIIRYLSYATQRQTNLIPGTRQPIRISYQHADAVQGADGNAKTTITKIPEDYLTMVFNMPSVALEISGVQYGTPDNSKSDGVCHVNDQTWPLNVNGITARKVGYWMLNKYETAVSRYAGYFSFSMQAGSRVIEDWSETGILRSSLTGKYAKVEDSVVTAMNNRDYSHGYIYPQNATEAQNGIVRIGGNPTTNFKSLFGIG